MRDNEDQDTLVYETGTEDWDAAQAFASNFEDRFGQRHEHHEHHQRHKCESERLQVLVLPAIRKLRWKKCSLLEASAAERSAVPPAPDSSEEVAAEVVGPPSDPSNRVEEVLPWLQALPKEHARVFRLL